MSDPLALIYLVDDDQAVLKALSRLLRSAGYEVLAFSSAREFMAHAPETPGCLVLDVSMPEIDGLELQGWLNRRRIPLPIIFLSGHADVPTSVRAMKEGAVDFLTKPVDDFELIRAIQEASRWEREARAARAYAQAVQTRLATLTPREREVLEHVVSGKLNKQIAGDLGTTEKTIKVHRARVMQKMQVESLAELVRIAERAGIGPVIPPPPRSPSPWLLPPP